MQPNKFYFENQYYSCEGTYCPSDDSYLLAGAIPKNEGKAIDMGCGSGIQTLNLFFKGATEVTSIDNNPQALKVTEENCKKAGFGTKVKTINSDLFSDIPEKANTIVFNPPYVPSDEIKYNELDGGNKGREILDKFLEQFPKHLEKNGACYFIQNDQNGIKETQEKLKRKGFTGKILSEKKLFFEKLIVIKAKRF